MRYLLSLFFLLYAPLHAVSTPARVSVHLEDLHPSEHLPIWYPESFDRELRGKEALVIIQSQGTPIDAQKKPVEEILFTDVDQTLLNTQTPILLKNKKTQSLVTWTEGGDPIRLPNRSFVEAQALLQTYLPSRPWQDYEFDFNEMGSVMALDITAPIENVLQGFKCLEKDPTLQVMVVTARSSYIIPPTLKSYLADYHLRVDAVFLVNNKEMMEKLSLPMSLTAAQRKALTMTSVLQGYLSRGFKIKKVSFYDDGDENLICAMQLLPQLFPSINFSFFDVIHVKKNCFKIALVAESKEAILYNASQKIMDAKAIQSYSSHDAPLRDEIFWHRLKRS